MGFRNYQNSETCSLYSSPRKGHHGIIIDHETVYMFILTRWSNSYKHTGCVCDSEAEN